MLFAVDLTLWVCSRVYIWACMAVRFLVLCLHSVGYFVFFHYIRGGEGRHLVFYLVPMEAPFSPCQVHCRYDKRPPSPVAAALSVGVLLCGASVPISVCLWKGCPQVEVPRGLVLPFSGRRSRGVVPDVPPA